MPAVKQRHISKMLSGPSSTTCGDEWTTHRDEWTIRKIIRSNTLTLKTRTANTVLLTCLPRKRVFATKKV